MKPLIVEQPVKHLEALLPLLEQRRASSPYANDVYEAATYWVNLGKRALSADSRVNYVERVREESALLDRLWHLGQSKTDEDQEIYAETFGVSKDLLNALEGVRIPDGGYLGILSVVQAEFAFLQETYGFQRLNSEPTKIRYSSGSVYIDLVYSVDPSLCCSFGPEGGNEVSFWIDDLLFLYGDERYRSLQSHKSLQTHDDVRAWFSYLAALWKQHGQEVLVNQPGIFARLEEAQRLRDEEYVSRMGKQPE